MQVGIRIFICISALIFSGLAFSAIITEKGMAELRYGGFSPSKSFKRDVVEAAKKNALNRYVAKQSSSMQKQYQNLSSEINENIGSYVISYNILDEDKNKDLKTYKVVLKAEINTTAFENMLNANSAAGNTDSDDMSYISFVFVARKEAEVKSYDAKVVKREDSSVLVEGAEHESVSESGSDYAGHRNTSAKMTIGGSSTQKADKILFSVEPSQTINVAMNEVLTTSNFEVVEAEFLEEESEGLISVQAFINDYSVGNDISSKTKRNAVKGVRMLEIPFFAMGTLDVGLPQTDSATGMKKVFVNVTGKVLDLRKRFPKTLASVGPVQYSGLGPNPTVAKNNALKLAAEEAAKELVNQLNSKNIK